MCKREKLDLLEDQIREEYSSMTYLEIIDEIDRLNKEEATEENKLRLSILAEIAKDCEMDEDRMYD